jgi:DNA-binding NarL/FixJ family response regulator
VRIGFLVIEDHPVAGRALRRALSRHGHAELVATRAEALERLAEGGIDGIVADVGLPDGSGFDVVREAKRIAPRVQVLVLSGDVDRERLREADLNDATYLLKPPALADLDRFARRVKEAAMLDSGRIDAVVLLWVHRHSLTHAEGEVLRAAAHGATQRDELARQRQVEPNTVKKQVQRILSKTGYTSLPVCVNCLLREVLEG